MARDGGPARLILDLWQRTRTDWSFASDRLASAFRKERSLGSSGRRFVAQTLYGMIRHTRRIDEALAAGGLRAVSFAPDRERLLAYLILEEGLAPDEAAAARPGIDWTAVAAIDERLAREREPWRRIALRHSLGEFLARQLVADHGDRAESIAAGLNQRAPMTVRANLLRATRDEVAAALAEEGITTRAGALSDTALIVESRTNLFSLKAFKRGLFEAQDEGSQLVADAVAPPPRARIVDFCAGAGGKTLAVAARMANKGRIVATDVDPRKLAELRRRARRAGVDTVQAVDMSADPDAALPAALDSLAGACDRVLVDAPCTGSGSLRRNPEARHRISEPELRRLTELQRSIVDRALTLIAPGGRLIYATCSVLAAENRAIVDHMLANHAGLAVMAVKELWGKARAAEVSDDTGSFLELFPDRHGTDGFFAAVVRRSAPSADLG